MRSKKTNITEDENDNFTKKLLESVKKGEEMIIKKDYHSAIEILDRVIENNIPLENAFFYRGFAKRELNQFLESIIDFNLELILNAEHIAALINCIYSLNSLRRFHESYALANKLVEIYPDGETYEIRGNVKKKLGDYKGAQEDFKKANEYPRSCF